MAQLRDVVAYLCKEYPHKQELSKARIAKMVYLAEFWEAVNEGHRLTDRVWKFRACGPYLRDIEEMPSNEKCFRVVKGTSVFGDPMELFTVLDDVDFPSLTQEDMVVLDHVIKEAATKEWEDLCGFVSATIPAVWEPNDADLDLGAFAKKCESRRAH